MESDLIESYVIYLIVAQFYDTATSNFGRNCKIGEKSRFQQK